MEEWDKKNVISTIFIFLIATTGGSLIMGELMIFTLGFIVPFIIAKYIFKKRSLLFNTIVGLYGSLLLYTTVPILYFTESILLLEILIKLLLPFIGLTWYSKTRSKISLLVLAGSEIVFGTIQTVNVIALNDFTLNLILMILIIIRIGLIIMLYLYYTETKACENIDEQKSLGNDEVKKHSEKTQQLKEKPFTNISRERKQKSSSVNYNKIVISLLGVVIVLLVIVVLQGNTMDSLIESKDDSGKINSVIENSGPSESATEIETGNDRLITYEELDANISYISVFESNHYGTDKNFGTNFNADEVRYLGLEIGFNFPPADGDKEFNIIYAVSKGEENKVNRIFRGEETYYVSRGDTSLIISLGYGEAVDGTWDSGIYILHVFGSRSVIASEIFQLY